MTKALHRVSTIISPMLFLLVAVGSAWGDAGNLWETAQEPDPAAVAVTPAEGSQEERLVEPLEQKGGFIGYNFVETQRYGGRAEPYGLLESSRSGGLFYRNMQKDTNLEIDGAFLNEHDYHGDLLLDYQGDYRLHLRTESLFHNLDRELLFSPSFVSGRTDAPTPAQYIPVQDPPQNYGLSVVQDFAEFRYRLHNYPLHVNLGYWRLVRDGSKQLIFSDASFEGSPNTVYAVRRNVNQQTQEGRLGVDAHLGPIDLIYDFKIRVFEDREPTPLADYVSRNDLHGNPQRLGGLHQHNEDPDSRYLSNTVKIHSSLSGGFVGSGSYSIDTRENLSRLEDTTGAKHTTSTLQNAAGDIIYTPAKEYSVALKYRRQELDQDRLPAVYSTDFVNPFQPVKQRVNTVKDLVLLDLSYRPRHDLSVIGEYRAELLQRDHVSDPRSQAAWDLPEDSTTHVGSLSANYRPLRGTRMTASYSYTTVDHPSYGASFQEKHEGKLLATYTRSNSWGATGNVIVRREFNDSVDHDLITSLDPVVYTPYPSTSRDRSVLNANFSSWVVPFQRVTLSANYAYLQTEVDQDVLFTTIVTGSQTAAHFYDRSHVYGVNATYAATDKLELSLLLQQVRSASAFQPRAADLSSAVYPNSSTAGISDITRQDTVISLLSARGEYRITSAVSTSLEYVVRDYDERNPFYSSYNGTVHTVFATVAAKW